MKKENIAQGVVVATIITLSLLLSSCETQHWKFDEGMKFGTSLTIKNNTYGVNDFKVGEVGTYVVSSGSIDYGRNIGSTWYFNEYEPSITNGTFSSDLLTKLYQDSIGTITFNENGSGVLKITNQDTLTMEVKFVWHIVKETNNGTYLTMEFEPVTITTYVTSEPLYVFGYQKVGTNLWKYQTTMDKYSGKWLWVGNKLMNDEGDK
jgi:hypothetical protein